MLKRIKYRYMLIVFEGDKETVKKKIIVKFEEMYGKYGLTLANIKFIDEFKPIVIKINVKYLDKMRGALALIDTPLRTVMVSGCIKKIKEEVRKWI